jgi:transposase
VGTAYSLRCIYALLETCKLNDGDPRAWLADVLARIADHPMKQIADLLPWNWKAARAAFGQTT